MQSRPLHTAVSLSAQNATSTSYTKEPQPRNLYTTRSKSSKSWNIPAAPLYQVFSGVSSARLCRRMCSVNRDPLQCQADVMDVPLPSAVNVTTPSTLFMVADRSSRKSKDGVVVLDSSPPCTRQHNTPRLTSPHTAATAHPSTYVATSLSPTPSSSSSNDRGMGHTDTAPYHNPHAIASPHHQEHSSTSSSPFLNPTSSSQPSHLPLDLDQDFNHVLLQDSTFWPRNRPPTIPNQPNSPSPQLPTSHHGKPNTAQYSQPKPSLPRTQFETLIHSQQSHSDLFRLLLDSLPDLQADPVALVSAFVKALLLDQQLAAAAARRQPSQPAQQLASPEPASNSRRRPLTSAPSRTTHKPPARVPAAVLDSLVPAAAATPAAASAGPAATPVASAPAAAAPAAARASAASARGDSSDAANWKPWWVLKKEKLQLRKQRRLARQAAAADVAAVGAEATGAGTVGAAAGAAAAVVAAPAEGGLPASREYEGMGLVLGADAQGDVVAVTAEVSAACTHAAASAAACQAAAADSARGVDGALVVEQAGRTEAGQADAEVEARMRRRLLALLCTTAGRSADMLDGVQAADILTILAFLSHHPPAHLLAPLLRPLLTHLPSTPPDPLSMALWALARLHFLSRPTAILIKSLPPVHGTLSSFPHPALARTLYAVATLRPCLLPRVGRTTIQWLNDVAHHVRCQTPCMSPQNLAICFWSLTRLIPASQLLVKAAAPIAARLRTHTLSTPSPPGALPSPPPPPHPEFTQRELLLILYAYTSSGSYHHLLWASTARHFAHHPSFLAAARPQDLALWVWTQAKAKFRHHKLTGDLAKAVRPVLGELTPQGLAMVLWGFAVLGFREQGMAQDAAQALRRVLPKARAGGAQRSPAGGAVAASDVSAGVQNGVVAAAQQPSVRDCCQIMWSLALLEQLDMATFRRLAARVAAQDAVAAAAAPTAAEVNARLPPAVARTAPPPLASADLRQLYHTWLMLCASQSAPLWPPMGGNGGSHPTAPVPAAAASTPHHAAPVRNSSTPSSPAQLPSEPTTPSTPSASSNNGPPSMTRPTPPAAPRPNPNPSTTPTTPTPPNSIIPNSLFHRAAIAWRQSIACPQTPTPRLHLEVSSALQSLHLPFQQHCRTADGQHMVQFVVRVEADRKVAIITEGPGFFTRNTPARPLGTAVVRRELIRRGVGMPLVVVRFDEWRDLGTVQRKCAWLLQRVEESGGGLRRR